MAGEKTNTRQKMINMMYLVFIAMLALNIDKEVLATIGVINEDLETSIEQLSDDNVIKYATIDNLQSQPEYQVVYPFAPDSTILIPMALILRVIRYIGVAARMVVVS